MQQLKETCILVIIAVLFAFSATSQKKQLPNDRLTAKEFAPVFKSSLGNVLSNTLPASMMKQLLDSTLISRDSAGHRHPVVSFDFGYRTGDTYSNDSTGRPQTSYLYTSFHFDSNRLDSLWRTRIGEKIKSGDEIFFDHIIAKDKKGTQYLSSPLHFKIH